MKRTTITDIANKLHVSLNTVNKALYGKKGIGEELRAKILMTAKAMNYQVNRVAQSMARNPVLLGILDNAEWRQVSAEFKKGIDSALERLRDYNVHGRYYEVPMMFCEKETSKAISKALKDGVTVLICNHVILDDAQTSFLEKNGIRFAFLGTDMPDSKRLACVRSDGAMAGRMAAEMLSLMLPKKSQVAIMTGYRSNKDHEDKVENFIKQAAERLDVVDVYEHFDKPKFAAEMLDKSLSEHPGISGVYAATANSPALCKRLVELGLQDKISIVATDLHGRIRDYLRNGVVKASLYQDCAKEGERMVELIYAHLSEGKDISKPVLVPPTVVLSSNLELF